MRASTVASMSLEQTTVVPADHVVSSGNLDPAFNLLRTSRMSQVLLAETCYTTRNSRLTLG